MFQHDRLFGDYVELRDRGRVRLYDKAVMRAYLDSDGKSTRGE